MKKFIPAIAWGTVILVLSIVSGLKLPKVAADIIAPDKLAHAGAYFLFCALLIYGFHRKVTQPFRTLWMSFLLSAGYGFLMEVLQYSFFPHRYFEVWDIVANIIGSMICVLVSYFFIK